MNKNKSVEITINGKKIIVAEGITILQAAREQGWAIPTLCNDQRLKPFASCFVCVVEVEKTRNLVPSCSTVVSNGMVIHTNNEKVLSARKMALDLLLSDHTGDCIAPCSVHCPAHTDVQGYVAHIANGDPVAAVRLIKKKLALPVVCGTICPNPCEHECRRGLVDEPIAIRALKRFAAEYDLAHGPFLENTAPDTGKKVAVIGGGPAGLAGAFYLRQKGHEVHLFEALEELGGMTRYGIPKFRLPWDKLDAEIKAITDLGIHVHTGKRLGKDFHLKDLKTSGHQAILMAIGAHVSKKMNVANENTEGVIGGIDFLRKIVLGEKIPTPKRVAVIGGGDVAMDCARVARRLGAHVEIVYRRSQEEMPALEHEQHETQEEGVVFRFLTAPESVIVKNGKATGLKVAKMKLGAPDSSGRRSPVKIEGATEDLEFDLIIAAIGQDVEGDVLDSQGLSTTKWKTLVYDPATMVTPVDGIFAAGDCAYGPNTVVHSLAEGYIAAKSIDSYLNDVHVGTIPEYAISKGRIKELSRDDFSPRFEHKKRFIEKVKPAKERLENAYSPINMSLPEASALAEAARCIECGCQARFDCKLQRYSTVAQASEKVFSGLRKKLDEDTRHPLIKFSPEKCINCGSCVRMCSEVRGIGALSFINRGIKTMITPVFGEPLQNTACDSCGMCIDVCPTGAIVEKVTKKSGPWPSTKKCVVCTLCPKACEVELRLVGEKIISATSLEHSVTNGGVICRYGRFFHHLGIGDYPEKCDAGLQKKIIQEMDAWFKAKGLINVPISEMTILD